MSSSRRLRVMLSSRCNDEFPTGSGNTLSESRLRLKQTIESMPFLGRPLLEVWINEDAPPGDGVDDSWESCLTQVRECDVLVVLSNGNAGWAKTDGDIGICHAEYMEGLAFGRGKVRLIALPTVAPSTGEQGKRNQRFQAYVSQQSAFRGGVVKSIDDLEKRVFEAIADAVVTLTQRGVSAQASARFDMGPALDWSRLDFKRRKQAIENVITDCLGYQPKASRVKGGVVVRVSDKPLLFLIHGIPAALSVAAARELVGRPFLNDHERVNLLKKASGPIHLIGCHRSATESQATALLGFPDATIVTAPFGIYVADEINKVQFVFLTNCRDDSHTRHAVQRFLEWLEQTGEARLLGERSDSRKRIVSVIATELERR